VCGETRAPTSFSLRSEAFASLFSLYTMPACRQAGRQKNPLGTSVPPCPKAQRLKFINLKRAVEPQKAHRTQKNQKLMLVKYFTPLVSISSLLTSCFFSVVFVPYVAICLYQDK
jgi:hypothetical protein